RGTSSLSNLIALSTFCIIKTSGSGGCGGNIVGCGCRGAEGLNGITLDAWSCANIGANGEPGCGGIPGFGIGAIMGFGACGCPPPGCGCCPCGGCPWPCCGACSGALTSNHSRIIVSGCSASSNKIPELCIIVSSEKCLHIISETKTITSLQNLD